METTGTNASFSYPDYYAIFQSDTNDWGLPFKMAVHWIRGTLPLPLYIIGTFGNVISIVVLSRVTSDFRSSHLCFLVLAVSDFLIINFVLLDVFIHENFTNSFKYVSNISCKMQIWILFILRGMSCWMPVLLTVERAVAVLWPHRVGVLFTYRRTKLIILAMTVFFPLFNSHYIYGFQLRSRLLVFKTFEEQHIMCIPSFGSYEIFRQSWTHIESTVYFYLPLSVIVVGNVVLVNTVVRSARSAVSNLLTGDVSRDERRRKLQSLSLVRTVLVVSGAFFCFLFPESVYCAVFPYRYDSIVADGNYLFVDDLFVVIVQQLFFIHSVLNPYVYILTGRKFRQECSKLLCSLY